MTPATARAQGPGLDAIHGGGGRLGAVELEAQARELPSARRPPPARAAAGRPAGLDVGAGALLPASPHTCGAL